VTADIKTSSLAYKNGLTSTSGVPRNFVWGGGSTNSVEDREQTDGDLGR